MLQRSDENTYTDYIQRQNGAISTFGKKYFFFSFSGGTEFKFTFNGRLFPFRTVHKFKLYVQTGTLQFLYYEKLRERVQHGILSTYSRGSTLIEIGFIRAQSGPSQRFVASVLSKVDILKVTYYYGITMVPIVLMKCKMSS